ncbi:uncharacterized protein EAF01_007228 [Botrytis porri]|uniref:uncharacterized protein n=1 Tax=Botrytis porri TaxID=87229 RepID=UPI0019017986|nr:uncharacterized protein EAF01_007228 [Botrytis porri]KAF7901930.1 hypothetical protein EAF01_007228 [Botrytis porri]
MENTKGNKAGPWLKGDSLLAILAGSEPTAQILTAIFHELSMHREHIAEIREELGVVCITDIKAPTKTTIPKCQAMRLHPNLLTGGSRKTTESGVTIDGVYIPPHITVVTPHYTIAKCMLFLIYRTNELHQCRRGLLCKRHPIYSRTLDYEPPDGAEFKGTYTIQHWEGHLNFLVRL